MQTSEFDLRNLPFTVIICTRDRLTVLRETVQTTLSALVDFPNARLLIVDNGSTDGTTAYLDDLSRKRASVVAVFEPTPGLYHARVRALHSVDTEIMLFIDDDITVGENWPGNMISAILSHPRLGLVGSAILPIWIGEKPSWFGDKLAENVFGLTAKDSGRQKKWRFPSYPPGGSLALRRTAFLGLYDAPERKKLVFGWGAKAVRGGPVGGEDWDLSELYIKNGYAIDVLQDTIVYHRTLAEKVSPAWVLEKFERDARCRVRYARVACLPYLSHRVLTLLAAFPGLLVLEQIGRVVAPTSQWAVTISAYSRRARGFWREMIWGVRDIRFPYYVEPAMKGRRSKAPIAK